MLILLVMSELDDEFIIIFWIFYSINERSEIEMEMPV
jgi:hypothetical protein